MSDQEDDMPSLYHLEEEEEEEDIEEDIELEEEDYQEQFGEEEEEEEEEIEEDQEEDQEEEEYQQQQQEQQQEEEEAQEEQTYHHRHDAQRKDTNDDDMLEDLLETMLDGEQKQVTEERPVSVSKTEDIENEVKRHRQDKGHEEDGGGMVDYLQQFDDMYTTFPRDPVDGTIIVDDLNIEQRKIYNAKVMSLLTENQMDRYECFRRSSLKEPMRRLVQMVVGGGQPKNTDKIVIAMSGVAKVFVGELIEESRRIADARGNLGALSKEDVCEAYFRVTSSSRELRQSHGKRMRL